MQIEIEVKGSIADGHIEVLGNYFIEKMIEDLKKEQLATKEA